jgi:serine/threonine protein phosphatase PrpC
MIRGYRLDKFGKSYEIGVACLTGSKSKCQDGWAIAHDVPFGWLVLVTDGHGANGHDVSALLLTTFRQTFTTSCMLCYEMLSNMEYHTQPDGLDEVLQPFLASVCQETQDRMVKTQQSLPARAKVDMECSGSTLAGLWFLNERICVHFHVGDSESAVVYKDGSILEIPEDSRKQRPDRPVERSRIIAAGKAILVDKGTRVCNPDYSPHVSIAMTRSFGDLCFKDVGVTCEPMVFVHAATNVRYFIAMTDGVSDVLHSAEVAELLSFPTMLPGADSVRAKASTIAHVARIRWTFRSDYIDDATVVLIDLPSHAPGKGAPSVSTDSSRATAGSVTTWSHGNPADVSGANVSSANPELRWDDCRQEVVTPRTSQQARVLKAVVPPRAPVRPLPGPRSLGLGNGSSSAVVSAPGR